MSSYQYLACFYIALAALCVMGGATAASMQMAMNDSDEGTVNETTTTTEPAGTVPSWDGPPPKKEDRSNMFEKKEMEVIVKSCNQSFTIPEDYLTELNKTGTFPSSATRDNKCFVYCVLDQLAVIQGASASIVNNAEEKLDGGSQQLIAMCSTNLPDDMCEKAYKFLSCYMTGGGDDSRKKRWATTAETSEEDNEKNKWSTTEEPSEEETK